VLSGLRGRENEVFALVGCYAALIDG